MKDHNFKHSNEPQTHPWGYVKLIVFIGSGEDVWAINSQLIFVPCRSVYNYILGQPFMAMFDVIALPVHLKFKYHNLQEEPNTTKGHGDQAAARQLSYVPYF